MRDRGKWLVTNNIPDLNAAIVDTDNPIADRDCWHASTSVMPDPATKRLQLTGRQAAVPPVHIVGFYPNYDPVPDGAAIVWCASLNTYHTYWPWQSVTV